MAAVNHQINPLVRGFSGGGTVETAEQLMARMAQKYGTAGAAEAQPEPEPATAPAPPLAKATPKSGGLLGGAVSLLKGRKEQIDKAVGYRNGGKILGPGTPTSDSIPAKVKETGEPIEVSTGERIVSAAQEKVLQKLANKSGFDSLDALLEAGTGKPVGPTMQHGVKHAATGDSPEDEMKANPAASVPGIKPPPAMTVPTGNGVSPLAQVTTALKDRFGNDMTATNKMKAQLGEAPVGEPATPTAPATTANPAASVMRDQHGNDMTQTNAMKQQLGEKPIGTPYLPASLQRDPSQPVQTRGYVATQAGQMNPAMERVINAQPNALLSGLFPDKQTQVPQITGTSPVQSVPPKTGEQAGQPAVSPATVIAQAGQATLPASLAGKVTTPPAGPQSLPSATPIDQQAQTPGAPNASPQNQDANPLTSINMQANNDSLARANTTRQQMIDGDGQGPKVTMIENSGLKETQELMDKWGRQDMQREMLQEIARNPRAANAIAGLAANANNTEAQLRGQDVAAQVNQRNTETTQRGQDITAETTRRGQDVHATVEANRLAGNPLDNSLKQVQVQTGQTALDRAKANEKAIANINAETDPIKRQAMIEAQLVAQGKNPLTDRYIKVEGGEEIGPDGITKIKRPSGVYDTVTQQFKPMEGAAKTPASAAPTYDVFAAQMKARYPGKVTDDQLKAEYARQFGSK